MLKQYMNNIKNVLLKVPLLAFIMYSTKLTFWSFSYPEAIVMALISAVYAFKMLLKSKEPKEVNVAIRQEIEHIKNHLSKMNIASIKPKDKKRYF